MWVFLLVALETARNRKSNPHLVLGPYRVPTWALLLFVVICTEALVPDTSLTGHLCGAAVGYACMFRIVRQIYNSTAAGIDVTADCFIGGLGLLKWLCPPEKVLRWIESKLNLRRRLPNYATVDQKTYGRFGVLPSSSGTSSAEGGTELVSI